MSVNLLGEVTRIETPFIKVTIGTYTFGVYDKVTSKSTGKLLGITYPNYVKSLNVKKINGSVNTYTLKIVYPITESDDPNFFEKVFSSVSETRKIKFSYGDLSLPSFIYKDEEALITDVKSTLSASSSTISYDVTAVSSSSILSVGCNRFPATYDKPSNVIKKILKNRNYGLQQIFSGMNTIAKIKKIIDDGIIASDDKIVNLEAKTNISVLDYLSYLVDCMIPISGKGIYSLIVIDDTSNKYGGTYFKVLNSTYATTSGSELGVYSIDIGYPTQKVVTNFSVDDNQAYSIFYNFSNSLVGSDTVQRINDEGELEYVYAPVISSSNSQRATTASEQNWWKKVTSYPISATLTIKGLLRASMLMTHIRLNVYFYGRKHTSSGLYVITKQVDEISESGFKTTLNLTRISNDDTYEF